jgi:hypothetical protein
MLLILRPKQYFKTRGAEEWESTAEIFHTAFMFRKEEPAASDAMAKTVERLLEYS